MATLRNALSVSSASSLEALQEAAVQWARVHGLVKSSVDSHGVVTLDHVPMMLLPSTFPKEAFDLVYGLQPLMNKLLHCSALDTQFLHETLAGVAEVDEFVGRLLAMHRVVVDDETARQTARGWLGIWRTDYMLHAEPDGSVIPQQVEKNAISVAYCALSSIVSRMHRFLAEQGLYSEHLPHTLPPNDSLKCMTDAFAAAHAAYGVPDAVIVMVVQAGELNAFDQRWIEYDLWDRSIRLVRRTHAEIGETLHVDDESRTAILDGKHEVAVFYFRAGYTPADYPSELEWTARLRMERSRAFKAPSIAHQLAGTKKVQQVLSTEAALQRFLSPDEAKAALAVFTQISPLDGPGTDEVVALALASPDDYVLKPQREGGGNNFYRQQLHDELSAMSAERRKAFILMRRIAPPSVINFATRHGQATKHHVSSEIGVFGFFLSYDGQVQMNCAGGYLLRSKPSHIDDGGVSNGIAFLDSLALVPHSELVRESHESHHQHHHHHHHHNQHNQHQHQHDQPGHKRASDEAEHGAGSPTKRAKRE